jgi:hypothetical protein
MREWWQQYRPSPWTLAVLLIALGSASLLLVFGYVAVHKFAHVMDPYAGCGCNGGGGFPL